MMVTLAATATMMITAAAMTTTLNGTKRGKMKKGKQLKKTDNKKRRL